MEADRAITFKRRTTLEFEVQSQSSGLTRLVSGGRTCLGPPTRAPDLWASPLERARIEAPAELPEAFKAENLRLREATSEEDSLAEPVPQELLQCYENLKDCLPVHIEPDVVVATRRQVCYGIISACPSVAASGTHNVILGLRAFLDRSELMGSRLLGIRHLANGNEFDIETQEMRHFLNQGGCDMLPTLLMSRVNARLLDKLVKMVQDLQLDGLLMLCGAGEMEHVIRVSNHFAKALPKTPVVAVVHSLSGWARLPGWMPTNLGFDSAASVLAEVTGNVALSRTSLSCDFYHFLCCGSPPLTLEVSLQIRPTLCYIGADIALRGLTLQGICDEICDVIIARHHDHGLHSGEILVSDDFLEELAEMRELKRELIRLRQERPAEIRSEEDARQALEPRLGTFFELLPSDVQHDLVYRNCTDGRPLLSTQDVDRELGALVARNLQRRAERGERSVKNFAHFPRSTKHLAVSPMPTPLDCALGTALGHAAGALLLNAANGYVASIRNVASPPEEWKPCGVPLLRFLKPSPTSEAPTLRRHELTNDGVFGLWRRVKDQWRFRLSYRQPGPVQYWGPGGQIHAWMTYTLRAACGGSEQFEEEVQEASKPDRIFTVPLPTNPCSLVRRREALLSPLQRWRCAYQPQLPKVLQGCFRISEVDRKGRVCADPARLSTAFPNLWRNDHVKHVIVETMPDEVNVLQMLPERASSSASLSMPRSDSWGAGSGASGSSAAEQKSASPRSRKDESGLAGADVEFSLKQSNLRIGVALVGRAGPGMNNVIQGLHDFLKTVDGKVVCIAMGIAGLVEGHVFELTEELLLPHRNQGGCDLLGQSQPEDLFRLADNLGACAATVTKLELDGLVVWGGRNVHSWTVELAEYFVAHQVPTRVIGVPASVESDLPFIEQTLGHDTVCRLFSSIVGNLATQAASSKMQWCFVRIPGRSISHIAAEVALETLPHVVLLAGEMHKEEMGLSEVTQEICNVIEARGREEMNYGVVIIPDQFMTAVREMRQLALEVHEVRRACPEAFEGGVEPGAARDFGHVSGLLPPLSRALFQSIPERVRAQICMAKVDMRNSEVDLSGVETEVIFKTLVEAELTRRVVIGTYKGPFQCRTYSLPYHGRATMPTNFDCNLGYTIGYAAGILIDGGRTCLLVDITKLKENVGDWEVGAIPLCSLLSFDEPNQERGKPRRHYISAKGRLTYDVGSESTMPHPCKRTLVNPGPAQYEGPCANMTTQTLCMPQLQRVRQMALNDQLITDLKAQASAGCPPEILEAVRMLLQGGVELLRTI